MTRRYPFQPIEDIARIVAARAWYAPSPQQGPFDDRRLADIFGCGLRQLRRWRDYGVTEKQADDLAVATGRHPFEVWPEMVDDVIADCTRRCAGCDTEFIPEDDETCCSFDCEVLALVARCRAVDERRDRRNERRRERAKRRQTEATL